MKAKSEVIYDFLLVTYQEGILDKFIYLVNMGLEAAMSEKNLSMWDVLNVLDEAEEAILTKLDKRLLRYTGLLKVGKRKSLMRLASRMLNKAYVQRLIIKKIKKIILKSFKNDDARMVALGLT